jgi:periplasmic divalent cation tolerance protein
MPDKIILLTTCSSAAEAETIARALVEARLAACAAIHPGTRSIYRWKGQIETSEEWSLSIKTHASLFDSVAAEIRRLHSYETPEILAIPIIAGSQDYLDWMDEELLPAGEE